MSRVNRSKRSQTSTRIPSRTTILIRLGGLTVILFLLAAGGILLSGTLRQRGVTIATGLRSDTSVSLNPVEALYLSGYLSANQGGLTSASSDDQSPVDFEVMQGETASDIASRLVSLGIIRDAGLFRNYLRYYGLDTRLEAGSHQLSHAMTLPQIAVTLTKARAPEITIRIPEGWRREQFADWLNQQTDLPFSGSDFLAATDAGATLPQDSALTSDIPGGASLEGFLLPDTYRLELDATARDLVAKSFANLDRQLTLQLRQDVRASGLTVFQVVTLASIVEREAAVADERPIIASVYLNRLALKMNLEADPTVQYAMGYQPATGQWWNLNLTQDDYHSAVSPYNTYLVAGLPPGPIDSPSLASIIATVYPAKTPYLFFRAMCDGSGRHRFAVTYEEQLSNACP